MGANDAVCVCPEDSNTVRSRTAVKGWASIGNLPESFVADTVHCRAILKQQHTLTRVPCSSIESSQAGTTAKTASSKQCLCAWSLDAGQSGRSEWMLARGSVSRPSVTTLERAATGRRSALSQRKSSFLPERLQSYSAGHILLESFCDKLALKEVERCIRQRSTGFAAPSPGSCLDITRACNHSASLQFFCSLFVFCPAHHLQWFNIPGPVGWFPEQSIRETIPRMLQGSARRIWNLPTFTVPPSTKAVCSGLLDCSRSRCSF